jgi:hypothetical protein
MASMTHRLRRFVSLAGIAALLFMQIAVSAYACPGGMELSAGAATASQTAAACDEAGGVPSPLCHSHCDDGGQSLAKSQPPNVPVAIGGAVLALAPAVDRPAASIAALRIHRLSQPPEPRLSIRNCCFRL